MSTNRWVVAAKVGESTSAARTDSCGDMEQLELMDLILMSVHRTKATAEQDAAVRRSRNDGWVYVVLPRRDYEMRARVTQKSAA